MAKENKYLNMLEEKNKEFYSKIEQLGKETRKKIEECKILYSPAGCQIKANQLFQESMSQVEQMKDAHIKSLELLLAQQKDQLNESINSAKNKTVEEQILQELRTLNNKANLEDALVTMTNEDIIEMVNNTNLNAMQAQVLKKELALRGDKEKNTHLVGFARNIKETTQKDLLKQAEETVELYSSGQMFPGMPVHQQLRNGIENLMGQEMINKINEANYFGDGIIE